MHKTKNWNNEPNKRRLKKTQTHPPTTNSIQLQFKQNPFGNTKEKKRVFNYTNV